jgi:hypothetical protein
MAMTNYELEQKCLQVIAEATTRMQDTRNVKMREKWRLIRETWRELLQKAHGTARDR